MRGEICGMSSGTFILRYRGAMINGAAGKLHRDSPSPSARVLLFENISLGISRGERLRPDRTQRRGQIHAAADSCGPAGAGFRRPSRCAAIRASAMCRRTPFSRRPTAAEVIARDCGRAPGRPGTRGADQSDARPRRIHGRARAHANRSPAAGSGGWPSRANWRWQPDLLFLDEPTNHLDFEGILLAGAAAATARLSRAWW